VVDSTNLQDDRFGYSCYALVFPVSDAITEKVSAIERSSGMTRAKIPAHITVKGTFHEIADLDATRQLVREVVQGEQRFWVSFEGARVHQGPTSAGLAVAATAEMRRLHDALVSALRSIATTVYPDDPYRAHMTLYQEALADGLEAASALIAKTEFGSGFEAIAVDLWGRHGPAHGGSWELVERFPLR
jgi:hypothetical protein